MLVDILSLGFTLLAILPVYLFIVRPILVHFQVLPSDPTPTPIRRDPSTSRIFIGDRDVTNVPVHHIHHINTPHGG